MQVKVLGCSGAIAKGSHTTSFLVDHDWLVDAGTGVGQLTLPEMQAIDHVFITHAHLDHIASLPLMLDAVASLRRQPLQVHALPDTIAALRAHIFNGTIWPDFSQLPSPQAPLLRFVPLALGQRLDIGARWVQALPAHHTVPACGYAIGASAPGARCWVFSGDTGPNPALWQHVNQLPVGLLVIETAFSQRESALATESRHLHPAALVAELAQLRYPEGRRFPVGITHPKPAETELILSEIRERLGNAGPGAGHDIRWLAAGDVFEV